MTMGLSILNPIRCAFDPEASGDVPDDPVERALWAGIKFQHVTSQYFRGNVADVARRLRESPPGSYEEFMLVIDGSPLRLFGRDQSGGRDMYSASPDHGFWKQMWSFVSGEEELRLAGPDGG